MSYEKATAEVIEFEEEDIITTSVYSDCPAGNHKSYLDNCTNLVATYKG